MHQCFLSGGERNTWQRLALNSVRVKCSNLSHKVKLKSVLSTLCQTKSRESKFVPAVSVRMLNFVCLFGLFSFITLLLTLLERTLSREEVSARLVDRGKKADFYGQRYSMLYKRIIFTDSPRLP